MEIDFPTEKMAELFVYFVTLGGKKIEKLQLCDLLWPELTPEKEMHNEYNTIYRLKNLFKHDDLPFSLVSKKGYYEFLLIEAFFDFFRNGCVLQRKCCIR